MVEIALKEKENTRKALESMDCEGIAELCSLKTGCTKGADRKCERLYHCLMLKKEGPKVYEGLIFDVEPKSFRFYIEELNMSQFMKPKSDSRVKNVELHAEELKVEVSFKPPYIKKEEIKEEAKEGNKEEGKEEKKAVDAGDKDVKIADGTEKTVTDGPPETAAAPILPNMFFKVFDRVKLKMDVTNDHPMDVRWKLMVTEEDLREYDKIK